MHREKDRAQDRCHADGDEKKQIQALDRTQPSQPLKMGRAATMTHDYVRHGITTLFAALSTLDGKVISTCMKRHDVINLRNRTAEVHSNPNPADGTYVTTKVLHDADLLELQVENGESFSESLKELLS